MFRIQSYFSIRIQIQLLNKRETVEILFFLYVKTTSVGILILKNIMNFKTYARHELKHSDDGKKFFQFKLKFSFISFSCDM